jgi:hypothetical protein
LGECDATFRQHMIMNEQQGEHWGELQNSKPRSGRGRRWK